jgi:hypothetical protein
MHPETPDPLARAVTVMSGFERQWFLCGGWSVDAWLGRVTRDHADIDVAVFQDEQAALYEFMADRVPIGHDDNVDDSTQEPWAGRWLDMPAHIHAKEAGIEWDFQLSDREGTDLLLRRDPRHTLPLTQATGMTGWGIPALAPPVIVYYKAIVPTWRNVPRDPPRAHDSRDFEALRPLLDRTDRAWLASAIASLEPSHPWLSALRP